MAIIHSASQLLSDDMSGDWKSDMADVFRILNQQNTSVTKAINGQLTFAQMGAKKIQIPSIVVPSNIIVPTLATNIVSQGAPFPIIGYWLDSDGMVHIKGKLQNNTGAPFSSNFFIINQGYRPADNYEFPCFGYNGAPNTTYIQVISSTGAVSVDNGSLPTGGQVAINVSFPAKNFVQYVPSCFPIKIQSTFNAGALLLGAITDLNQAGGQPPQIAMNDVVWHNEPGFSGSSNYNNIVIDNIPGLLPNRSYSVTLWAFPDQ